MLNSAHTSVKNVPISLSPLALERLSQRAHTQHPSSALHISDWISASRAARLSSPVSNKRSKNFNQYKIFNNKNV